MPKPQSLRLMPLRSHGTAREALIDATKSYGLGTGMVVVGPDEAAFPENAPHLIVALAPEDGGADAARRLSYELREPMLRHRVPALVVPRRSAGQGDGELSILLADDLDKTTFAAIRAAENLVELLGARVELLHLHVRSSARGGRRTVADLLERLEIRGARLRLLVEKLGGFYLPELWEGCVREELARAAGSSRRQVSVFGPHRALHLKPLALGRMPYEAMLGMNGAVLFAL